MDLRQEARIFRALGNPTRLALFRRLLECCPPGCFGKAERAGKSGEEAPTGQLCVCVGEVGEGAGVVASTISHHLKELREAGLISMERRGRVIECRIDPAGFVRLMRLLGEVSGFEFEVCPGGRKHEKREVRNE